MKLFIVACLKEYQSQIIKFFRLADIQVFSATDVTGFKNNSGTNLLDDWFASGDENFQSVILFSFTSAENAVKGMALVQQYNAETKTTFPVRAFVVPVEKAIY